MKHTFTFQHIWFNVTIKDRKVTAFEEHDHYAGGMLLIPKDVVPEHWVYANIANRIAEPNALISVQRFLTLHTDNGWRPKTEYRPLVNEYEGQAYSLFIAGTTVIVRARAVMCEPSVNEFFEDDLCDLNREGTALQLILMHNQGIIDVEVLSEEKTFNDIMNEVLPYVPEEPHDV
ncbi:hypothetical protein VPHD480_0060 [Vibrio phage D480]|nr:hypothetical protein MYOV011v1_p0145 [Vibrio phage 6E35.1a]